MKTICIILGLLAGSCVANATNQAKASPDKPVRLYVKSYQYSEHAEVHPSGQGYNSDGTQTYSFQKDVAETWETHWADGVGGGASYDESSGNKATGSLGDNSSSSTTAETYHWGNSDWPDLVEGTRTVDWAFTGNDGVTIPRSWSGTADPPSVARPGDSGGFLWIGYEHCVAKDSKPGSATWPDGSGGDKEAKDRVVYSRTAETVMKLFTGGKAVSKRKNLFMLSASAWRTEGMTLKPNLLNDTCYWEWDLPPIWGPTKQVNSTDIEIDGKPLGSDGIRWRTYADNDTRDVTPRVKNEDYYTFNEPTPPKYKLYVEANTHILWQDHINPLAKFCVGQYVNFTPAWNPPLSDGTVESPVKWVLGGTYVNIKAPSPYSDGCQDYYTNNPALLQAETTHAWWIDGQLLGVLAIHGRIFSLQIIFVLFQATGRGQI